MYVLTLFKSNGFDLRKAIKGNTKRRTFGKLDEAINLLLNMKGGMNKDGFKHYTIVKKFKSGRKESELIKVGKLFD